MSSNTRMISSLPILHESDLDIEQTKLAFNILRKISVTKVSSMLNQNNKNKIVMSKDDAELHERHHRHQHHRTNFYQNLMLSEESAKQCATSRKLSPGIITDQFNSCPQSAMINDIVAGTSGRLGADEDLISNNKGGHEMLTASNEDQAYCSQYYPNHLITTSSMIGDGLTNSTSSSSVTASSAASIGNSTPKLLFRSVSSPIPSTPDSILNYLTAAESSSSSTSTSSSPNSDDDENNELGENGHHQHHGSESRSSKKAKTHHYYDITSSSDSSTGSYSESLRAHSRLIRKYSKSSSSSKQHEFKDGKKKKRLKRKSLLETERAESGLGLKTGTDTTSSAHDEVMVKDKDQQLIIMEQRSSNEDLFLDTTTTTPLSSPSTLSLENSNSAYSTPCDDCSHGVAISTNKIDDKVLHDKEDQGGQSIILGIPRRKHEDTIGDEVEGEIGNLREQLQHAKFSSSSTNNNNPSPDEEIYSSNNISTNPMPRSSENNKETLVMNDIEDNILIPEINLKSFEEYCVLFCHQYKDQTLLFKSPKIKINNSTSNINKYKNNTICVTHLQGIFDCFKNDELSVPFGEKLLTVLETTQVRDDFQWALHQMGGVHALLMLYGRIVEISPNDLLQSKGLNLVLNQLKNHAKLTDPPLQKQYHLIRYLLSSENTIYGIETYKVIMSHCLNPCSQRIQDYSLLLICIMESWMILIRTKCSNAPLLEEEIDFKNYMKQQLGQDGNTAKNESENQVTSSVSASPTTATLLEHFLTTMHSLCSETNSQRDINVGILKENQFAESLLTLCNGVIYCVTEENRLKNLTNQCSSNLTINDGLSIASLVKSILNELMAPPDAKIASTLVLYGLQPLLPNELPPLPDKEASFFVFPGIRDFDFDNVHLPSPNLVVEQPNLDLSYACEAQEELAHHDWNQDAASSDEDNVKSKKPALHSPLKLHQQSSTSKIARKSSFLASNSVANEFLRIFQETLIEGFMKILLNSIAIIPDGAFTSVLYPHLSHHVLIAYCSHSNVAIKTLALKLISSYLSRAKESVITDFLKNRTFFLISLYIQSCSKMSSLVSTMCHGFGPVSYAMMVGLIYSPVVVNTLIEWMKLDASSVAPALLSVGLLPSIIYYYKKSPTSPANNFPSQLSHLLTLVTKYIVLNPKNEPWSILFCPGIESSSESTLLCSKLVRDAIEILKNPQSNNGSNTTLKKSEISSRLLWLFESSVHGRYGPYFEKWLFNTFVQDIFEAETYSNTLSEGWKNFVKKNNKRLHYLMGLFLCNIFLPTRSDNNNIYHNFQQSVLRQLLAFSSVNTHGHGSIHNNWLIKVLKFDDQILHCFTAFIKIYFIENEHNPKIYIRRQKSFTTLDVNNVKENDLTPPLLPNALTPEDVNPSPPLPIANNELGSNSNRFYLSDRSINHKFETLLINTRILSSSSTNNLSSEPISRFTFNILLDSKSRVVPESEFRNYGDGHHRVSYQELRSCVILIEKLRLQQQRKSITKSSIIKSTFRRHDSAAPNNSGCSGRRNSSSSSSASTVPFQISNSKSYFDSVFETVNKCALEIVDVCTKLRARQEIAIAKRLSIREVDIVARQKWWIIRQNMVHPKAPWNIPDNSPTFWALDQSEGPGRTRIRLRKEPLRMDMHFVKPAFRKKEILTPPLQYLFYSSSEEFMGYAGVQSDIKFIRSCLRIVPGEELSGEIILTDNSLHFIPEICNRKCWDRVDAAKASIFQILRRRYTLEDRALEIFVGSRCYLFVFKTQTDREQFVQILSPQKSSLGNSSQYALNHSSNLASTSTNSELLNAALTTMTTQWIKGHLSNFDYLMHLNTAAGRTYCDLMQYPVFPFVLSKYYGTELDLNATSSFRDLRKPMAIQDPSREDHFISTYNYLKREADSPPFHYGSHYSNSGIVLHFLVRLPPYTQHFLKYQDGNFDIPDRSFHSIETAWRLASKDSNTDFKEMIPEFFYLPEFLLNLQAFDMGVRQNGCRVEDVNLPEWANGNARLFTLINRQALESNQVRKFLSDWIDLIFGYKQTGPYSVQALNVFHPSTYEGFEVDGDGTDELIRRARKAMVSTYGQTPKKLFCFPHPRPQNAQNRENEDQLEKSQHIPPVLENISGLKWGKLIGSPASSGYEVISTREFNETIELFETISRIVFWPERTLILGDAVVGSWDSSGIRIKSNILYLCIGDEITTCVGINTTIWIGHESGKIIVLKLSPNLNKVLESIDLVGHYKAVKCIDLNTEFSTAFSCSGEDYAITWDMNSISYVNAIENSAGQIDFVYSSRSTGDVLLLNQESNSITFTTINGYEIGKIEHDEKIESVCISSLDPGRNVNIIAVGCDYGIIRFYSSWDLKFLSQTKVDVLSTLPVKRIRYSKDGRRLYCLSQTDATCLTVALQLKCPVSNHHQFKYF